MSCRLDDLESNVALVPMWGGNENDLPEEITTGVPLVSPGEVKGVVLSLGVNLWRAFTHCHEGSYNTYRLVNSNWYYAVVMKASEHAYYRHGNSWALVNYCHAIRGLRSTVFNSSHAHMATPTGNSYSHGQRAGTEF